MIQTGTVELGEEGQKRTVTVKELTVSQVLSIFNKFAKPAEDARGLDDMLTEAKELFSMSIEGLQWEELKDFAPSELKMLYDKFREVNAVFFDVARSLGIEEALGEIIRALKSDFISIFAASSKEDTAMSSTTDTAIS